MGEAMRIPIADIKLDQELYPRDRQDDAHVASLRDAIDQLPPISVTHEGWLIDGYHRYLAHIGEGLQDIEAVVEEMPREMVFQEAVRRNAQHGRQLDRKEKRHAARRLFDSMDTEAMALLLAVTPRVIRTWTEDLRREADEARDERIWQAWLACESLPMIAAIEKVSLSTVSSAIENGKTSKIESGAPPHLSLYDVWNFGSPAKEYGNANYPGRIPGQIIENLLWYYTDVGDIVIDPMAGGGTTIDVCKAMGRRYLAFDLRPSRPDISEHDARQPFSLPDSITKAHLAPKLIFLDPPYWKQKCDDYAEGGVAELELAAFYEAMNTVITNCVSVLGDDGYIAMLMGSTQEEHDVVDHPADIIRSMKLRLVRRFIVPYSTQQYGGAHVNRARDGKYALCLYRDLMVWTVR